MEVRCDDLMDAVTMSVAVNRNSGSVDQQCLCDGCFGNIHDTGGFARVAGATLPTHKDGERSSTR